MRVPAVALLATGALLVASSPAVASLTVEAGTYPTGGGPYFVYTADFDSNGRPDLVTVNGDAATSSVYLRNAGSGFTQEVGSPIATASSGGAVGDLNGDGRPDLVVAGFAGEGVVIRLRNASGGFTSESSLAVSQATAVAVADFTGDGRPDLAVTSYASTDVRIFVRQPGGGFAAGPAYATDTQPRAVTATDVNGDGKLDLAVVNQGGQSVRIYLGAGNGTFVSEGPGIPVGLTPTGIASGDFDKNGRSDLAITNLGSDSVTVLMRSPSNTGFAAAAGSPFTVGDSPTGLAIADLDLDGRQDVVAGSAAGVEVLQGSASSFTRLTPSSIGKPASGIAVADYNQDGVPDVAATSTSDNTLQVLLGEGPPATPPTTPGPLTPPGKGELNLIPVSGKVKVRLKGTTSFVALTAPIQVDAGVQINATKGKVKVVGPGQGTSAKVTGTLVRTRQSKKVTTLALNAKLDCTKRLSKAGSRSLSFKGKGKFKVRGTFSETRPGKATYTVTDTCTSTTTKVTKGTVTLTDFALDAGFTVRAGHVHVAGSTK